VSVRATRDGPQAQLIPTATGGHEDLMLELLRWGIRYARAIGAADAHVYCARGQNAGLAEVGLRLVRPWWRMDRGLADEPPDPATVEGYVVEDPGRQPAGGWSALYNRAFADHWRFFPYAEEELMDGRD